MGSFDWGGRLPKDNRRRPKVSLRMDLEIIRKSVKSTSELDCETDRSSRDEIELSDPVVSAWKGHRSTDKSYPGDNRLISPKSPHRRGGLAPRCRLVASWGCSRSQGLGCSPIKAARELGSERRETVRSLSVAGVGNLRGSAPSTRGPGWTYRWCTSCSARSIAG